MEMICDSRRMVSLEVVEVNPVIDERNRTADFAVELVMSGKFLDARTAAEWGLVSRVVPDEELTEAGAEFAASVAAKSPLAVANAKEMMNHIWSERLSVPAGLQVEKERNSYYCLTAQDATEGLIAFRDKRTPRFTGT